MYFFKVISYSACRFDDMSIKSCQKHLHAAERGERACDSIKKARKKQIWCF